MSVLGCRRGVYGTCPSQYTSIEYYRVVMSLSVRSSIGETRTCMLCWYDIDVHPVRISLYLTATVSWWLECIYRLHVTDRHIEHQNKIKRPRRLSYEMDTSLTQSYGWQYYHTISFVPNEDHILPRQKCRDGRGYTITINHNYPTDGYPTRQRRTVQLKNGEEWGARPSNNRQFHQ